MEQVDEPNQPHPPPNFPAWHTGWQHPSSSMNNFVGTVEYSRVWTQSFLLLHHRISQLRAVCSMQCSCWQLSHLTFTSADNLFPTMGLDQESTPYPTHSFYFCFNSSFKQICGHLPCITWMGNIAGTTKRTNERCCRICPDVGHKTSLRWRKPRSPAGGSPAHANPYSFVLLYGV